MTAMPPPQLAAAVVTAVEVHVNSLLIYLIAQTDLAGHPMGGAMIDRLWMTSPVPGPCVLNG